MNTSAGRGLIRPNPLDLVGYDTLPCDYDRLFMLMDELALRRTHYLMGAKPDQPKGGTPFMWPPSFHAQNGEEVNATDCSGFARYAVWFMTHGKVLIPDGTYAQYEWFNNKAKRKFKSYNAEGYKEMGGSKDGHLRICICTSEDGKPYGHIWFDLDGVTYESYGGNGPGTRAFSAPVLERIIRKVFVVC